MKIQQKHTWKYVCIVLLWIFYCVATFLIPTPATNPYHLSKYTTYLIQASFIVPILVIWLIAVYGAIHLYTYAKIVRKTPDSAGFYPISLGINCIVGYLIFSSFLSLGMQYAQQQTSLTPIFTLMSELLYVIVYLVAFFFIFKGTRMLTKSIPFASQGKIILYGICLIAIMGIYLYLLLTNTNRSASYFLPDSLIFLLIVIPTFATWILSLLSYINLETLQKHATGIVYKKALSNLIRGLLAIIAGSIITQAFTSIGSSRFLAYGLSDILIIVYILLVIIVVGYIFLAMGAKKLTTVEEIS